jgi:hypothetical protein
MGVSNVQSPLSEGYSLSNGVSKRGEAPLLILPPSFSKGRGIRGMDLLTDFRR